MTVNRRTGIKELINLSNKCRHEIFYTNMHPLNDSWANEALINNKEFFKVRK